MRRNLSELQTDDEGFFEAKPTMEGIELAKVPEVPREVEEKRKHNNAENKITFEAEPPPRESRYAHLLKSESEEEETPEEQVNLEYLNMLHQCLLDKEKERARKRLALPAFAQNIVPDEHPEIVAPFRNFDAATPDERIQRWNSIKNEQKEYLASWKQASRAERLKAREERGQASGASGSRRVPTPPPPSQRSQVDYPPGATPKTGYPPPRLAENPEEHWMDK